MAHLITTIFLTVIINQRLKSRYPHAYFTCEKNVLLELPRIRALIIQGGSNMTGTDLYVNKPHCAAAVRP